MNRTISQWPTIEAWRPVSPAKPPVVRRSSWHAMSLERRIPGQAPANLPASGGSAPRASNSVRAMATLLAGGLLLTGPFYSQPKVSRARCPLLDRVEYHPGRLLDRNRQTTPDGRLSGSAVSPTQEAGLVASSLRY
jgi:hypothetical protein